jgi:hypothetical protein
MKFVLMKRTMILLVLCNKPENQGNSAHKFVSAEEFQEDIMKKVFGFDKESRKVILDGHCMGTKVKRYHNALTCFFVLFTSIN